MGAEAKGIEYGILLANRSLSASIHQGRVRKQVRKFWGSTEVITDLARYDFYVGN